MSTLPEPTIDVAGFYRLTSRGANGILVLFLLTQAVLTFGTLRSVLVPWLSILALLLVGASAIAVMRAGSFPLPGRRTAFVLSSVAVSTTIVTWNLPTEGWPGYASWHLGANAFVLLVLGLRGRVGLSWVGMFAMTAICVIWTVSTGQGIIEGLNLIVRQAAVLLIGTMFAVTLRPTAQGIVHFNQADQRRAAQEAETEAGERERQRQTARLKTDIEPVLRLIAADELSEEQRDRMRVLEASLRDEIRAGALLREPLISSVQRARERGVDLLLLDDSGGAGTAGPVLRDSIAWAAGAVDSLERGHAVIRLRPRRHDRFASIHIEDDNSSRTIEYPMTKADRDLAAPGTVGAPEHTPERHDVREQ